MKYLKAVYARMRSHHTQNVTFIDKDAINKKEIARDLDPSVKIGVIFIIDNAQILMLTGSTWMCHLVRFITDRGRGMYCTYTPILPGGGDNSLVESGIKGENFPPFSEGDFNLNPEGTVFYYNQDRETECVYIDK